MLKKTLVLTIIWLSGFASAGEWIGPFSIESVSSSAESCGTSCGSFYRLRVTVKEDLVGNLETACAITNNSRTFVYYSSTINSWGMQWGSLLMSAEAQGKEVMIYDIGSCSSIGAKFNGVKLLN